MQYAISHSIKTNLKTNLKIMKILINNCYGGYGFSDEFTNHINSLGIPDDCEWRDNQIVVEEAIKFGLKKASGYCAELTVEEIPDGAHYSVGEYDGQEWISDTWIEVTLDELRKGLSEEQLDMVSKTWSIKQKS